MHNKLEEEIATERRDGVSAVRLLAGPEALDDVLEVRQRQESHRVVPPPLLTPGHRLQPPPPLSVTFLINIYFL